MYNYFKVFLNSINKLIKLIFPPKCVLCKKIIETDDMLCPDCWSKISFIKKPYCNKCSTPFDFQVNDNDICLSCIKNKPLYIKARSAVVYDDNVSKIIFDFKFHDKLHLKRFMAKCMYNASIDILDNIDILIPVPLHKKRLIFRKYNQSLLLAKEIGKLSNKNVICDFLYKTKHTTPQVKLKSIDRKNNLKNKFAVKDKYLKEIEKYKNLNFAIVDDVLTTSSTVNECIKALNKIGIKNVYVITFAKTKL